MHIFELAGLAEPDYEGIGYGVEVELEGAQEGRRPPRRGDGQHDDAANSTVFEIRYIPTNTNADGLLYETAPPPSIREQGPSPRQVLECGGWLTKSDGSLRNGGIEYVFDGPYTYNKSVAALLALYKVKEAAQLVTSHRTGMHVHVDVRMFTRNRMAALYAAYVACEPWLMRMCGEWRWNNVFCVPSYANPAQSAGVVDITNPRIQSTFRARVDRSFNKYSALNFRPILSQGSVEFRMAPTYDNAREAVGWLEAVAYLVDTSIAYDANTIAREFLDDPDTCVRSMFPDIYNKADTVEWAVDLEAASMAPMQAVRAGKADKVNW